MHELGYLLTGFFIGCALGFHVACITMKKLIKDEPQKFAKIFEKK